MNWNLNVEDELRNKKGIYISSMLFPMLPLSWEPPRVAASKLNVNDLHTPKQAANDIKAMKVFSYHCNSYHCMIMTFVLVRK